MNRQHRRALAATTRAEDRSDPLDVKGRAARLARANATLFAEMRDYRDLVDKRQAQSPVRDRASCKTGCSACCRQAVLVELGEAQIIVARNPKTVTRLLLKIAKQVSRIASAISEADMAAMWMSGKSRVRHAATDQYWNLNMPCAFLENGRCSIYDDRPNACRTHFVSSDPAACAGEVDGVVTLLDLGTRDAAPLWHHEALKHAGADVVLGTLPQLILHAVGDESAKGFDLRTGQPTEVSR